MIIEELQIWMSKNHSLSLMTLICSIKFNINVKSFEILELSIHKKGFLCMTRDIWTVDIHSTDNYSFEKK